MIYKIYLFVHKTFCGLPAIKQVGEDPLQAPLLKQTSCDSPIIR